ncbi:MAG TPA: penicillin-binding protein 2 [Oligoflexia bacterium]|nr:penicillin-binding protein 2 [Oligoflexia bacterium]HMP48460.1 penicillin-binding protein 2 [Oligoflexia bacterium]
MKVHGSHGVPSVGIRQTRMLVLGLSFVIFSFVITARLFSLQSRDHSKWESIASRQHGAKTEIAGSRGAILDRNGVELAVSIPAISVGVHPTWLKNPDDAAKKLAGVLGIADTEILPKLLSSKSYEIIARGVSQAMEQNIRALKIYGVEVERDFNRIYPQGDVASTIIGRTGREGSGLSGIERTYQSLLDAPVVARLSRRDAKGRLISATVWEDDGSLDDGSMWGNPASYGIEPASIRTQTGVAFVKNFFSPSIFGTHNSNLNSHGSKDSHETNEFRREGGNVSLTIDSNIQNILEEEVDAAKIKSKAKHVFGLMMDAYSGEIIAMAQTSRFNPNLNESIDPEALRNIVLQNSFEPGSTFKPIIAAIALDKGLTRYDEIINCENGRMSVGKHTIRDVHPMPPVSFEQIIVRSSNIGMAKLGFRLGKERLYNSLKEFGFGEKSNVGIEGESRGIMRKGSSWAEIDIATHSFGQGVSVTALQLVRAYGALANGGVLVNPSIIKQGLIDDQKAASFRILKPETAKMIRKALNLVTEDKHGTGKNSRIPGVPVYGKTGTAQKAREGGMKGYDPSRVLASFVGFVDGEPVGVARTLVLYIAVDEPGVTPRWGGTLAAPVFKATIERTLSYLISQDPVARPQVAQIYGNDIIKDRS